VTTRLRRPHAAGRRRGGKMKIEGEGFVAEVKDDKLIIEIDLKAKGTMSASGKNLVIATTRGNMRIGSVVVGLNVYRKP